MSLRPVVVTGIGVISSLGPSRREFWEALREGRSGIGPLTLVDTESLGFHNGAEVSGFAPRSHFEKRHADVMDRFSQFGLVAAREAVADAAVEWTPELRRHTAVAMGSCVGGQTTLDAGFVDLYSHGKRRVSPLSVPMIMASAAASHICMEMAITGPSFTLATACSSSSHAIGMAFHMVRSGMVEMALAGGSDAPFSFGNLKAWDAIRLVAPDTCRPFSAGRRGMILGEGGCVLVLETAGAARARGARIYGEVLGFGMCSDAHHLTFPLAEGAATAMSLALGDAGLDPVQIGYLNAHGTATQANDSMEVAAIHKVFCGHTRNLAVSSTKSMHGHALGAAGAMEAAATLLALHHGVLPPTVNFLEPDPECDLDVIPNHSREAMVEYALSNSFAFGGMNAALAFRRAE